MKQLNNNYQKLFDHITHGDDEHRQWLHEEMLKFQEQNNSKFLYVSGDDFSALFFEDWVINNKLSFEEASNLNIIEDDEGYAEIELKSVGEVCPSFIEFVKDIQDYEDSKNQNFYFPNDKIFNHE